MSTSHTRPTLVISLIGISLLMMMTEAQPSSAAPPQTSSPSAASAASSSSELVRTFEGATMGTTYRVLLVAPAAEPAGSNDDAVFAAAIEAELESVNSAMSTYREDSEITRFNNSTTLDWFPVSAETAKVVARGQEIAAASGGAFDVTVGPLVDRFSFGPDRSITDLPSDDEIAQLKQHVGYQKLEVRLDPPALKKSAEKLRVDLSAIAKGYGVDRVAEKLEQLGIKDYLVEVGGEVRCLGNREPGIPWRPGIRRPTISTHEALGVVNLAGRSLATSGDYENFYEVDGQRYSHTIDPATGRPVAHPLASVSIVAADCMTADALATMVSVVGYEQGLPIVRKFGGTLFVIEHQGTALVERGETDFPWQERLASAVNKPAAASLMGMVIAGAIVFGIALAGMAIGVMFGRKPIAGSCGGMSSLQNGNIPSACVTCGQKTRECSELQDAIRRRQNP